MYMAMMEGSCAYYWSKRLKMEEEGLIRLLLKRLRG
jgi:hypothetical protein